MFNHNRPLESGALRKTFTFAMALMLLKGGDRLQRAGWNGPGQYVALQEPDEHSKMRLPYAYLVNVAGQPVPWVPSQGDLFAEDWQIYQTRDGVTAAEHHPV